MNDGFYSVRRFDGKKDLNGKEPSLRIICNNRTSGKTTSVGTECLEEFCENGNQFYIIFRNKYEIKNAHHSLDSAIDLWNSDHEEKLEVKTTTIDGDIYSVITINDKEAGFAIPMKSVDSIKKYSNRFTKTTIGFLDEFQLESGSYIRVRNMSEPEILQSIITSISRGQGQRARKTVFYLIGNPVSDVNPYYYHFGIYKRMKPDTKWMRGDGWVLDCEKNKEAADAMEENELLNAFGNSKQLSYIKGESRLFDNDRFIVGKLTGKSRYICSIIYDGEMYGLRQFFDEGKLFISKNYDPNSKNVYAVKKDDMAANIMLSSRSSMLYKMLLYGYENGMLFFDSIGAQNLAYEALAVNLYF